MSVTLGGSQLDVVLEALDDAREYRLYRGPCEGCDVLSGRVCDDHKADAQKGIRYASLALQLEKAAGHG